MTAFADFSAGFFRRYFELHPTDAIYYGVEGYDHLLNDHSDETYAAEKAFVRDSLNRLQQISPADLSADEAIDYALLEGKLTIQTYEFAKEDYRLKSPDTYSPIEAIYILTVRATNDLPGNLLSRLNSDTGADPARHCQSKSQRSQSPEALDRDGARGSQRRG